ncbi:arsenate reductase (glutaredoxin) [Kordia zhangzhouensis]|uniref:arsenate reductase (glutaredoxin) n=1 Tax=Kordia zhangzhouensis TaxID=1620405 RepID=UPI000629726F|nr:arsenate reductase (glutaredoxin) [Kordia zhangzhouensis]
MLKIYHNPRCRKSREGLAILEASGKDFEIVNYLDAPLSVENLTEIIQLLKISPIELIRTSENIWKENYKGKELSNAEIIQAMAEHPKLIERPIVIHNQKAVIGRPPEKINDIL